MYIGQFKEIARLVTVGLDSPDDHHRSYIVSCKILILVAGVGGLRSNCLFVFLIFLFALFLLLPFFSRRSERLAKWSR